MVLNWFGSGQPSSVDELIARKKYGRALELIRAALKKRRADRRLRLRLADVLVMAGEKGQAVKVLNSLADDVALAGNAAQAIALLKRVDSLQPGRPDVAEKLAYFIRQREKPPGEDLEWEVRRREAGNNIGFDMEEIPEGATELQLFASTEEPEVLPPEVAAGAVAAEAAPEPAEPEIEIEEAGLEIPDEAEPAPPPRRAAPAPQRPAPAKRPPTRVKLMPTSPATPASPAAEMPTQALRDELTSLLEEVLQPADEEPQEESQGGAARSPLFSDFSHAELVDVIRELRLEGFEPGAIIVTEGEPGDSLYVVASGLVRAFVRSAEGHNREVRQLPEGEFFGEISLLSGSPRTATITAATPTELLVLDKPALEGLTARHPRVREVLQQFRDQRAGSTQETQARQAAE